MAEVAAETVFVLRPERWGGGGGRKWVKTTCRRTDKKDKQIHADLCEMSQLTFVNII